MQQESRIKKTLLNARINTLCYFAGIVIAFFSRKIFIDHLGVEFLGLTSTLSSLLGFLNIAELGIGAAIGYVLYKPIYDGNQGKIKEIVSVFGYLYRWVGIGILILGLALSLFIPVIYPHLHFSWAVIYIGFYAYLISSLIGYFANYRSVLLSADQRNYEITGYYQLAYFSKTLIQMALAYYICNYILYFVIEILFGITYSFILNYRINKVYPWLHTEIKEGRKLLKKYPDITKYVKQLFIHKIGEFVQFQISPLLIYGFVSITVVTYYINYTTISDKLKSFITGIIDSPMAGIGNLISEGNNDKTFELYKELMSFSYYVAGILSICIFMMSSGFIELWLGKQYILQNTTVLLISVQLFMAIARRTNDQFIYGYGLFYDIWSPAAEVIIYILAAVYFGSRFGLNGVLAGPLISLGLIIYLWKPYFLFSKGLKKPFYRYWILFFKYILLIAINYLVTNYVMNLLNLSTNSWLNWLLYATLCFLVLVIISAITFSITSIEFRNFVIRLIRSRKSNK